MPELIKAVPSPVRPCFPITAILSQVLTCDALICRGSLERDVQTIDVPENLCPQIVIDTDNSTVPVNYQFVPCPLVNDVSVSVYLQGITAGFSDMFVFFPPVSPVSYVLTRCLCSAHSTSTLQLRVFKFELHHRHDDNVPRRGQLLHP